MRRGLLEGLQIDSNTRPQQFISAQIPAAGHAANPKSGNAGTKLRTRKTKHQF
jgi:hypothetical protein